MSLFFIALSCRKRDVGETGVGCDRGKKLQPWLVMKNKCYNKNKKG